MLFMFFVLMVRRRTSSTRTDTLFPDTTLFQSDVADGQGIDEGRKLERAELGRLALGLRRGGLRDLPVVRGRRLHLLRKGRAPGPRERLLAAFVARNFGHRAVGEHARQLAADQIVGTASIGVAYLAQQPVFTLFASARD